MNKETTNIEKTILTKKVKKLSPNRYLTGSELLDIQVGGGEGAGYPLGKIINLVGDKSSGKTFLACEIVASAHYRYLDKLKWIYDDCESGFSFNTKKLYGFEIMPLDNSKRTKSKTVEDLYCNVRIFLESLKDNEFGIYVIDSLDGLDSIEGKKIADQQYKRFIEELKKKNKKVTQQDKEKIEKKVAGSYRMGKPKYLSNTFFPQLTDLTERKNALVVVISQIRYNITPGSFEKYTRSGGKAMDFYAHTVLWLANINKILNKGIPIGITVKAKNTKSKTPRPYRSCFIKLYFEYGLDDITTNIDYLYDFLTPQGKLVKNPRGNWDDKSMSRNELVKYIEENNVSKELKKKVKDKWEEIENSVKLNRKPKYEN
jgi:RecA/RadA recombinase